MSTPQSADTQQISSSIPPEIQAEGRAPREWQKQLTGLILGLVLAALVYLVFPESSVETVLESENADPEIDYTWHAMRVTAATAVLMGTWWMTEAIPLAATALIPIVVFPLAQVAEFSDVGSPYASATIFLFLGGFLLALGLQRWDVHKRIALMVVLAVGTSPRRLILGFMIATGFVSMWVSNTATAVVMLPIGISVLSLTAETMGGMHKQKKFATALMLSIAYSASIGSVATLIGTPPNALLAGYMETSHGIVIGFAEWMIVGLPLAIVFLVIAWLVLITVFKPEMKEIPGGRQMIRDELGKLGRWTFPQIAVSVIFVLAAVAWVAVPLIIDGLQLDFIYEDAVVGMAAGVLMFIIPANGKSGVRLLSWETANGLPWDVLLLFGGGLSLSAMFTESGLSLWIGEQTAALGGLPTIILIAAIAALVLFLTEFTSNTATAATFLPILGGVAAGIGLTAGGNDQNVLLLTVPVALAATCAFMMPVATPPNAIAYGSGYVKIGDMIKGGIWLNLIALVLITITVYFLAIPVFGIVL